MAGESHGATTIMREWRLQRPQAPEPGWFEGEHEVGTPWLHLQYGHTAVRAVGPAVQREIPERYAELERLCLLQPELGQFYRDNYITSRDEATAHSPMPPSQFSDVVWHFVTLQVRFAEYVFTELALGQYANAPQNRGWMNLLRLWGRSVRFDSVLLYLAPSLREDFVHFYHWYLRAYTATIDAEPVPHPWDSQVRRLDARALRALDDTPMERHTSQEIQSVIEYLPGCFLDSGRFEARPDRATRAAGRPPAARRSGEGAGYPLDESGYLVAFAPTGRRTPPAQDAPPPPAEAPRGRRE